jgi:outer membrane protein OmpA-like peptidoglycan-associated protein
LPTASAFFLLLTFIIISIAGCARGPELQRHPVVDLTLEEPGPTPTPRVTMTLPADQPRPTPTPISSPTPGAGAPVSRPGNPAALGEEAALSVGRQFDPVFFDSQSSELDGAARYQLDQYSGWLAAHPRVWITLVGHCGPDWTIEPAYSLAMARALAVQDFLVGQGLDRARFYPISYGVDRPLVTDGGADAVLNNRVELLAFMAPEGLDQPPPITIAPEPPPQPIEPEPVPPARVLR